MAEPASVASDFKSINPEDFEEFIESLKRRDPRYRNNLSKLNYAAYSCYISSLQNAGYSLSHKDNEYGERELANVFSTVSGTGFYAVQDALHRRDRLWLSCFSGLKGFYGQFGFVTTRTEENWISGGPDVVYMTHNRLRFKK
jgi:hypothetical protein